MSLSNPNSIITEQRLSEFYQSIYPYLGSGGESHVVYGFHIDNSESVPSSKVTYLADAVGMTPAHMDYTNDVFDYGSWGNAFFMPKPCMLKYDGTVDYYLDPNDYTKKEDGTASDVANTSYAGNAMMEWGQNGKKIWLKIVPDASDNNKSADVYIADYNADGTYTCWPFHNLNSEIVDHFYTAIYNGSLVSSKFRSLSGQQVSMNNTMLNEIAYAEANNPSGSLIWGIETVADIQLINFLLILICKTTDIQSAIGKGISEGPSSSNAILTSFRTGVHNSKGLFYGTNSNTNISSNAVKAFGMENWWGFQFRRFLGEISVNGTRKYKLTYGSEDGSTVTGYNGTGNGYFTSNLPSSLGGTSGSYISEMRFTSYGMFAVTCSGSESTYYCDAAWLGTSGTKDAKRCGNFYYNGRSGPFCFYMAGDSGVASSEGGCAISAKPLSS